MKKFFLPLTCLFVSLFCISCNNETEEETAAPATQAIPNTTSTPPGVTAAPTNTTSASTQALNPAHGAPGHRCDIAVGAPLNSPAATTAGTIPNQRPGQMSPLMQANPSANNNVSTTNIPPATVQSGQPVQAPAISRPVTTSAPTTTTAAGMNPPHGQPNHRCDIAVGAPLNSPPGKPNTTTAPAASPLQPAQPASNVNVAGLKINPPHGQPGHDCTVEVGKPLKNQ